MVKGWEFELFWNDAVRCKSVWYFLYQIVFLPSLNVRQCVFYLRKKGYELYVKKNIQVLSRQVVGAYMEKSDRYTNIWI